MNNMSYKTNSKFLMIIYKLKIILILVILLQTSMLIAQNKNKGIISGKVVDQTTGEIIIGANVVLSGTSIGATTDIEGYYRISGVEAGSYELVVSYVSYAKTKIPNIKVTAGETTIINVTLLPETVTVGEVVVTSKAETSYENALLSQRKKASSISDGISAEQIKRSPDVTSSDALKRVTGVSIVENKFVYVRGTSERYSNALLNNAPLSSSEPDKKSFAFDLFPSNLIDNTIINKSFTPDKPGDFAGGLVEVKTIDFPDKLKLYFNIWSSFTNNTTFKNFNTYNGGKTDFLGIDDGTRKIPDAIPPDLNKGNYSSEQILNFAKLFKNNWQPQKTYAPLNGGFLFSIGDGTTLLGENFGFVAALSYRNNFSTNKVERNEYESDGAPRFMFKGDQSTFSTIWGGIFNISYKLAELHKISFKNTYSRTSDDEVAQLNGAQYSDAGTDQIQTALRFSEREVYSGLLIGEHFFPTLNSLQVEWRAYNSISKRNEPDYRRIIYGKPLGENLPYSAILGFQVNLKNGGRFFSDLYENTRGFAADFTLPASSFKIKYGGLFDNKHRDFSSRLFGMIVNAAGNGFTDYSLYYQPIDQIFAPENFRKNGFSIQEYLNGTNNYNANQKLNAGYLMIDYPVIVRGNELRIVGGVRLENSNQEINSRDLSDQKDLFIQLKNTDLLPSLNLIYKLSEITNIRVALSQTVNRPELRELAPFAYFDFYTQTSIRGNENLRRALIKNYDFRFEIYPAPGEMLSSSFFYKDINGAIEQVIVSGSALGSERTFLNANKAKIYGLELEGRISLGKYFPIFSAVSLNANYSFIKSTVDVEGSETTIARKGRPLQGQSPYVINLGLNYSNIETATSVSLLYNKIGKRIVEVATAYVEDVIELPRDVIDLTITQGIFNSLELKLAIKDLLGKNQIFMQGERIARSNSKNSSISLGISYKL